MTQTYSKELAGIDDMTSIYPSASNAYSARLKRFRATINLSNQKVGDTIVLADLHIGFIFSHVHISTDTSLDKATLSIGSLDKPEYYLSPIALTAVNQPIVGGSVKAISESVMTNNRRIIATVGAAALPASGTLVIDIFASMPN